MTQSKHVMILASAGSGKTYALTNRFVALLAGGAKPDRIVALTFTRKAAGEFFDEILAKLARAAKSADQAAKLAADIGRPEMGRQDFLRLLRVMTDAMPRLKLGTLDSFFARIVRSFPLELGLAGDFEVLQEHAVQLARQQVLRQMFARVGVLDAAQEEFIEAFKRATIGRETKRLGAQLDDFIDRYQDIYLDAPAGELWGEVDRIWPAGNDWLGGKPDLPKALRELGTWLKTAAPAEKQRGRWEMFILGLEEWVPGVVPPRELVYVMEKVLANWVEITTGNAILEFDRKKQELSPSACAALGAIARHVVGGELQRRIEMTKGIYAVLRSYEGKYHEAVRRTGKLTFSDVQRLLTPGAGAPLLSGDAWGEGRLYVDYRLDAEIDHWLLDEFQDTSFGQWSVLRNLIDEVVQDETNARSLFCVGDIKQAIFSWRSGDPKLLREIFNHYNAIAPRTITEKRLVASWRSGPALIEMVNAVFGDATALENLFPGEISSAWNTEWRAHESAVPDRIGQAAWLWSDDETERHVLVLELLRELRPLEHGLTCAVIVRTNRAAAEMADYLRREGLLPAVAEADLHICTDNPVGASLLALVQAAAYPHDSLAQEHVKMSPLGTAVVAAGLATSERLTDFVLGQVHAEGFERTMEFWWRKLEPQVATDDLFSRLRASQVVTAARVFDGTGSRDVAEFGAFMKRQVVRELESAAVIRVLTIHKAKGLGFDVVFLPDLEGSKLDQARDGPAVHKGSDRSIEWVLDLPTKLIWQHDPVLAAHMVAMEAEAGYEALSLLYVAMTRAKRAMYVITDQPGSSTSRNYPRVLAESLGVESDVIKIGARQMKGAWSAGDSDWITSVKAPIRTEDREAIIACVPGTKGRLRLKAQRPSKEKRGLLSLDPILSVEGNTATEFGRNVHELLAEVEWSDSFPRLKWSSRGIAEPVLKEAKGCLKAPGLEKIWTRPDGAQVELWRERSFEVILGGKWVTGIFDRVILTRDDSGRCNYAWIIDYKTDRKEHGVSSIYQSVIDKHTDQLNLYRAVVALIVGISAADVRCSLALTSSGGLVEVPYPQ